ncbi:MAG: cysteine-rich CWC family protein [Nitrososphaeraceae archaeon]
MEKICQGCGEKFQCLGNEECWCHSIELKNTKLSRLKSLGDDCFCEKCLSSK